MTDNFLTLPVKDKRNSNLLYLSTGKYQHFCLYSERKEINRDWKNCAGTFCIKQRIKTNKLKRIIGLFFRYLVESLKSESIETSYVGLGLSKDYYAPWIFQVKSILQHCLAGLENLRPDEQNAHKSILLRLHTLVCFTSPATWAILKAKSRDKLRPGMKQLCANIMGHLVNNGFYSIMQVTNYFIVILSLCKVTILLKVLFCWVSGVFSAWIEQRECGAYLRRTVSGSDIDPETNDLCPNVR